MSGRHAGWRRLLGDTAERPELLDFGKKLLAYLESQRRLGGASTLSIQRTLGDGSVVLARFVGDLPEIYVHAAGGRHGRNLDGFVVTARSGISGATIATERPEQLIALNSQRRWRTLFSAPAAQAFAAYPHAKDFYTDVFPQGLSHGGRIDWTDWGGQRLSWSGPSSRYWFDAYRAPSGQYSGVVCSRGQVVFDVVKMSNQERPYVVGAALHSGKLRVMLAAMEDPRVGGTSNPSVPQAPVDLALVEFGASIVGGAVKVDYPSENVLWASALPFAFHPWMASPDGSIWLSMAAVPGDEAVYLHEIVGSSAPTHTATPSTIEILGDEVSWVCAVDFKPDGSRSEVRVGFTFTTQDVPLGVSSVETPYGTDYDTQVALFEAMKSAAESMRGTTQQMVGFIRVGGVSVPTWKRSEHVYAMGGVIASPLSPGTPWYVYYGNYKTLLSDDGERIPFLLAADARHDACALTCVESLVATPVQNPEVDGSPDYYHSGQWRVRTAGASVSAYILVRVGGNEYVASLDDVGTGQPVFAYLHSDAEGEGLRIEYTQGYTRYEEIFNYSPGMAGKQEVIPLGFCYPAWFNVLDAANDPSTPIPDPRLPNLALFCAGFSDLDAGYWSDRDSPGSYFASTDSSVPVDSLGAREITNFCVTAGGSFVFSASVPVLTYQGAPGGDFYRQVRRPKVFMSNIADMPTLTGVADSTATRDAWCSKVWLLANPKY